MWGQVARYVLQVSAGKMSPSVHYFQLPACIGACQPWIVLSLKLPRDTIGSSLLED